VRTLRQVGDLTLFQAFLRTVAARSGQLLNLSDVARDLGVAVNTARAWLSILVESEGRLVPIEVKLSATPRPAMAAGIATLREALREQVTAGYVVHPGDVRLPLGGDVTALPIGEL